MDITLNVETAKGLLTKTINISYTDTDETLLYYIASEMDSLPKYLVWDIVPAWKVFETQTDFSCKDLLSYVLNSNSLSYPNVPKTEDLQRIFINTHVMKGDNKFIQYFNQKDFQFPLQDLLDDISFFRKELSNKDSILEKRNVNLQLQTDDKYLQQQDSNMKYKRFIVKLRRQNLTEIFDSMVVSKNVPFIIYSNVVKTFANFIPDDDWLDVDSSSTIIFKINHNLGENFSTGLILEEAQEIFCILDTSTFYKNVEEKMLLSFLRKTMQDESLELSEQILFFSYNIIGIEIYDCYLADMIMHNHQNLFYVDEFLRPTKSTNRLYIHLADETATINVIQKYTQRAFQFSSNFLNTPYLRVRIKSESLLQATRARFLFASLLTYYYNNLDRLTHFYKKYIPLRKPHKIISKIITQKPLKLIAPEIFLPMYSRRCLNMPTIIDEEDIEDKPHIKFPMFGESQMRVYVCDHSKYKYPGLRVNELANRQKFPYVPCCYSKDQKNSPDSKLNKYINKQPVKPKIKHSRGAILNLPVMLKQYFTFVDVLGEYVVLSNPSGKLSFPSAVYYSLEKKPLPSYVSDDLAAMNINICSQEDVNLSIEDGIYPEKHIRLVEDYFKVSIFLYDKNGPILPKFPRRYIKGAPRNKTVLVYIKSEDQCLPIVKTGTVQSYLPYGNLTMVLYEHIAKIAPQPFTDQTVYEYFSKYPIKGQILNSDKHCIFFICTIKGVTVPVATEPLLPFQAPILETIDRLKSEQDLCKLFIKPKYIVVDGIVVEVIIPFSSSARILTQFRPKENTNISSKEQMFHGLVEYIEPGLDNFRRIRRKAKNTFKSLESLYLVTKPKDIKKWVSEMAPPLVTETDNLNLNRFVDKLSYLMTLKLKNTPQTIGIDTVVDPEILISRDRQVISSEKMVLTGKPEIVKFKTNLEHIGIKEKVLVDGQFYTRIAPKRLDLDLLPEVVYSKESNCFYSLAAEKVKLTESFKVYVEGDCRIFMPTHS